MRLRSSRTLRQVSWQACWITRSSSSDSTVIAMWAWMRWGAQWNTGRMPSLHRAPGFFDALLVAECHVLGGEGVILAVDDELAVEAFEFGDGLPVDGQAPLGLLQEAPVAGTAAQRAHALAVPALVLIGQTCKLGLEFVEALVAMGALTAGLLRVEAHRVAAAALAVADHDLLDLKLVGDLAVAARAREHRFGHLVATANRIAIRYFPPPLASAWKLACETMPASPTNRQRVTARPTTICGASPRPFLP